MPKKPHRGGKTEKAMKYLESGQLASAKPARGDTYIRKSFHLLVTSPISTNHKTEKTDFGMSSKMT